MTACVNDLPPGIPRAAYRWYVFAAGTAPPGVSSAFLFGGQRVRLYIVAGSLPSGFEREIFSRAVLVPLALRIA